MLEIGKIPPDILEKLILNKINASEIKRDDVVIRPKTGEDCTAVDIGNELCVLSTDPITGASEEIGYLAVQINCNDIFSSGAEPIGILLTIFLPPNSSQDDLKNIMIGAERGAKELNIEILGGHTEVSDAVVRPIISATVVGKTKNKKFISTATAKASEKIIMTKWAGLEGTTIIAHDYEQKLLGLGVDEKIIQNAKDLKKFLSIAKESKIATEFGVSAMHDVTEGGILGAVWEMAECSNLGAVLYENLIPVKDETIQICKNCQIDYLKLISSGVMIISVADDKAQELVDLLNQNSINSAIVGEFIVGQSVLITKNTEIPIAEPTSDEIYNINL